jgi:hypothetical protein
MEQLLVSFRDIVQTFRDINEKYKTPHIKMTPMVNWSLLLLRIYLFGMIAILVYKFVTVLVH